MYAADVPFIEKWRQAMRFLDEDADSGYQKIWFELQAMGWNDARGARARLQGVHRQWVDVVRPAFEAGLAELGVDPELYPTEAVVALVVTFNEGIMLERLSGVDSGHRAAARHDRPTARATGGGGPRCALDSLTAAGPSAATASTVGYDVYGDDSTPDRRPDSDLGDRPEPSTGRPRSPCSRAGTG